MHLRPGDASRKYLWAILRVPSRQPDKKHHLASSHVGRGPMTGLARLGRVLGPTWTGLFEPDTSDHGTSLIMAQVAR